MPGKADRMRLLDLIAVGLAGLVLIGGGVGRAAEGAAPASPPVPPASRARSVPSAHRQILEQAQAKAVEQILTCSHGDDSLLRANAIEAMEPLPHRVLPLAQLGLEDEHRGVRYAALVAIGKLKIQSLGPAIKPLLGDPSRSVQAAALFAAHQCGLEVDISDLAGMLQSSNPTVRGNAVQLVGMMGDPSAVPMLEDLATARMPRIAPARQAVVRFQFAEAMLKLGDNGPLDSVRAGAYSLYDEVRVLAVSILGKIGDQEMEPSIRRLLESPPIQVRLAAAESLARMGSAEGLAVMLKGAAFDELAVRAQAKAGLHELSEAQAASFFESLLADRKQRVRLAAVVRSQAAFGLGRVPDPQAATALVALLNDPDPHVRLSAAASVLGAL